MDYLQSTESQFLQAIVKPPLAAVTWAVSFAFLIATTYRVRESFAAKSRRLKSAEANDPSLLKKHTTFASYETQSGYKYPRIRTFYKAHVQSSQLPKDLPLLVFTHGLGGSASQFTPLLTSLINSATCFAIDFPGCGRSDHPSGSTDAYCIDALAELLATAVDRYRDKESDQKVILIGHSMGCSINALLASSTSPLSNLLKGQIIGVISICPRAASPTSAEVAAAKVLGYMPLLLFDLLRWYERRGGLDSRSVTRIVGLHADGELRKLQRRYNEQSESMVFLRMMAHLTSTNAMPGREIWSGVKIPLFLIAGAADTVTLPSEVDLITAWLRPHSNTDDGHQQSVDTPRVPTVPASAGDVAEAQQRIRSGRTNPDPPRTQSGSVITDDHTSSKHSSPLKTTIFPAPSAHGLLYSFSTVRILSGMIENFLADHIDKRLGTAWQMHHLQTSGKWDVKNLKKWQSIDSCSEPIGGIFRAMKTMREVDEDHCPKEFVKRFSSAVLPDGVAVVVDISHESPVYHPQSLQVGGVDYHKFPTVSKEKPKPEEVVHFNTLIDDLRKSPELQPSSTAQHPTIGVHCHYGFNRTGFFVVCYLVERMGYRLQDALQEFAEKRPPGVKHEHFVNELHVRYAVNMERRGTIIG